MFKHILKVTFSNIRENKLNFAIIFLSLVLASLTVLFILNYIISEYKYDGFSDSKNIYRISAERFENNELVYHSVKSYPGLQAIIEQEVPDIRKTTRLLYEKVLMRYEDKIFNNQHIFWGDGAFFEIFGLELKSGSDFKTLYTKNTCFISESAAKRFFGDTDPLNKTVLLNQALKFVVTGVFKDIPNNSHLQCDFLVSYITLRDHADEWITNSLESLIVYTYFKKDPKSSAQNINSKLETIVNNHFNLKSNVKVKLEAQPVSDIHLKSHLNDELKPNSYFKYIVILLFISVFLIVCGWINYFNLLSLNFIDRIKNINIRFSLGASKGSVLFQFIVESVLVNTLCVILAFFFYLMFFNNFRDYLQIPGLELSIANSISALAIMLVLGFILGIILPVILLNINIFKTAISNHKGKTRLQAALISIQFVLLGSLLIFSMFLNNQVSYMLNSETSYSMDNVLITDTPCGMIGSPNKNAVFNSFRNELIKNAEIVEVTTCSHIPGKQVERKINRIKRLDGTEEENTCNQVLIDEYYQKIFNFTLLAGRSFEQTDRNTQRLILVNEEALKLFKFASPEKAINSILIESAENEKREYRIIGVIKNYYQESLKKRIEPIIYSLDDYYEFGYYAILYKSNQKYANDLVKNAWNTIYPKEPISITHLKTIYDAQYASEIQLKKLVALFILVISVISFVGLFTISLFLIKRESKEIGVRKVLGAFNFQIVSYYVIKFLKIIVPSMLISLAIGYYALIKFCQMYPNHIDIGIFMHLLLPTIAIMGLSILIITSSAGFIANINPARTTKYE